MMTVLKRRTVSIFVDKSLPQWIVRDPDGTFWLVPATNEAWEHRQPYTPTDESDLEPVPGHYKDMLGLPF